MATLLESYGDCFRKYATFRGRSARKEYVVLPSPTLCFRPYWG